MPALSMEPLVELVVPFLLERVSCELTWLAIVAPNSAGIPWPASSGSSMQL